MILEANYPTISQTIVFPNAEWGNFKRNNSNITMKKSMDGARVVTYVQRQTLFSLNYTINFNRAKSNEMLKFAKRYMHTLMRLTDHLEDQYIGHLNIPIVELEKIAYWVGCFEEVTFSFSFEGRI